MLYFPFYKYAFWVLWNTEVEEHTGRSGQETENCFSASSKAFCSRTISEDLTPGCPLRSGCGSWVQPQGPWLLSAHQVLELQVPTALWPRSVPQREAWQLPVCLGSCSCCQDRAFLWTSHAVQGLLWNLLSMHDGRKSVSCLIPMVLQYWCLIPLTHCYKCDRGPVSTICVCSVVSMSAWSYYCATVCNQLMAAFASLYLCLQDLLISCFGTSY